MDKIKSNFLSLGDIGHSKVIPGTIATVVTMVLIYFFKIFTQDILMLNILLPLFIVYVTTQYAVKFIKELDENEHDKPWIVIDEFIGIWVASLPFLVLSNPSIFYLLLIFVLFRFFDILKPLGIKKIDQWKNPYGVILDDILAGVYTIIIVSVIHYYFF